MGMTRTLNKLSDVSVKATKKAGRHSEGGGLYLNVAPSGSKSWLFMWAKEASAAKWAQAPTLPSRFRKRAAKPLTAA